MSASLRSASVLERDFDESEEQALARQQRQQEEAAALFALLDVNRSGEIDLTEAKRSLPGLGWQFSEEYIDGLWRVYDVDGSGALRPDEFARLLSVLRSREEREQSRVQRSVSSTTNPLASPPLAPDSSPLPTRMLHVGAARPYGQPLPGTPPRPVPVRTDRTAWAGMARLEPEPEPEPQGESGPVLLSRQLSTKEMIQSNASAMTEDEMADLMYAFQAADMDGSGAIDTQEFKMMLEVMGCQITTTQVQEIIRNAKTGFREWLKASNEENLTKVREIWEEFDVDSSGTMDLQEINAVIRKLQSMGYKPEPMSSGDLDGREMTFDEFTAWFLKVEGLPDDFSAPDDGATGGLGRQQSKKKMKKQKEEANDGTGPLQRFMVPFMSMTKKVASGPAELLARSLPKKHPDANADGSGDADADNIDQMMRSADENNEIIFAEYVFMMRGGALSRFLPGEWQERAADMRKLRDAFNTADVDGNNELELEELEMVIIAMNPKANISTDDIKRVWAALNPEGKPWITFIEWVSKSVLRCFAAQISSRVVQQTLCARTCACV